MWRSNILRRDDPFPFDWVTQRAEERPDAPAIGTPSGWITYGELAAAMGSFAGELFERGVKPASFVIIAAPAGPAAVAAVLATQALGACAVELNRENDLETLRAVLAQTNARHVVIHGRDAVRWSQLARECGLAHLHVLFPREPGHAMREVLSGVDWTWVDEASPSGGPTSWAPHRDDSGLALLVYTSGSTGKPKGVMQTHANVHANTSAICEYLNLSEADRAFSTLPLFYCFGRSILQTHLYVGGSVFFDHRFMYPRVAMEAMVEERATGFYGVPMTFEALRRQVDVRSLAVQSVVRYVAQAGGAMRPETIRWAREAFAPAPLFVMYGQTEATARLSYLPPQRAKEKEGSIGSGLVNVELRVVDDAMNPLPPRALGEIVARGPSITAGYFGATEEDPGIHREGWLLTGDLGWKDEDGFVFIVGRSTEMLKIGGHRVSAAEIEGVLLRCAGVREVAVIGVPDDLGGEEAVAFVVAEPDDRIDSESIRRFCRGALPAFKTPREIFFVEALPRTASGKVSKTSLRDMASNEKSILEGRAEARSGE